MRVIHSRQADRTEGRRVRGKARPGDTGAGEPESRAGGRRRIRALPKSYVLPMNFDENAVQKWKMRKNT